MGIAIKIDEERIREFCRTWNVRELSIFGSVLRSDFSSESDVDLLVTFAPEARPSLLDHVRMRRELSVILGRPVDLVTRKSIERGFNPIRREDILSSARIIYAA